MFKLPVLEISEGLWPTQEAPAEAVNTPDLSLVCLLEVSIHQAELMEDEVCLDTDG